ncbi:probable polygalacturonase At3g15720 [Punica granatum]|uniref:Probable polygalacturonase At3g15720 n=1 Tax=Punica granatum TaxID=22663 RepID=A0A6P8CRE7_PUNGR|nr:probable polygalacturonase At3g15720 [Punica granatum]
MVATVDTFMILQLVLCIAIVQVAQAQDFNVLNYGARGDGITDDSKAFSNAWKAACGSASGSPTLQIPQGMKFLLKPITFKGPCKSSTIHVQLFGSIIAPSNPSAWAGFDRSKWLMFEYVNGLILDGNGRIDGQGSAWWQLCGKALVFHATNNLKVDGLTHLNSQRNHISINGADTVVLSNLHISAPEESHNTDGIDISNSKNIQISHSNISTGDDCVAINGGSSFINISDMTCGPGHGISVGSLGKAGAFETVEDVHVQHCTFIGTTNGARIKTWQGGSGYARRISFKDITLVAAQHPILISQFYTDFTESSRLNRTITTNDLKVSEITFARFHGTSATPSAITFQCSSQGGGCTGLRLDHIHITSSTGGKTFANCSSAHGSYHDVSPRVDHCLLR